MCNLENIIEDCRKKNRKAEERLYNMFAARMFALCIRYSRDRAEAEDNFQDGFVKVFESLEQYKGKGSFEGWMKRIFINIALEKYRKKMPVQLMEEMPDIPAEEFEETICIPEKILCGFVEELPEKYKLVFNLYVGEELRHKEIAEIMGITEGTSKSNLARARDILKKKIKKYQEQYGG